MVYYSCTSPLTVIFPEWGWADTQEVVWFIISVVFVSVDDVSYYSQNRGDWNVVFKDKDINKQNPLRLWNSILLLCIISTPSKYWLWECCQCGIDMCAAYDIIIRHSWPFICNWHPSLHFLAALVSLCYFSVLREAERIRRVREGLSLLSLKVSDKITTTSACFILFVPSGKRAREPLCLYIRTEFYSN